MFQKLSQLTRVSMLVAKPTKHAIQSIAQRRFTNLRTLVAAKLVAKNMTRFHGRFRYDENKDMQTDGKLVDDLAKEENKKFEEVSKLFEARTNAYFKPSMARKDPRSSDHPEKIGDYYYTSSFASEGTNDYEVVYRAKAKSEDWEKVLDLREVPFLKKQQLSTARLTKMTMSDDQSLLAFIIDPDNTEETICGFRDLKTGIFYKDRVLDASNVVFPAGKPEHVFYVSMDDNRRTNRLMKHKLGDAYSTNDEVLYVEQDEAFYLDFTVSKDQKFYFLSANSKAISEVYYMPRIVEKASLKPTLKKIVDRKEKIQAFPNHIRDFFILLTNANKSYDYMIACMRDNQVEQGHINLKCWYQPPQDSRITEIDIFKDQVVLYLSKFGVSTVKILKITDPKQKMLASALPEYTESDAFAGQEVGLISPGINSDYEADVITFHLHSPFLYNVVYQHIFRTQATQLKEDFVLQGPKFDRKLYLCEQVMVPSSDGVEIPMTLIRKKKLERNRQNKCLMIGYGAYGVPVELEYNNVYLAALEQGWIIACTHVRGGNEKGHQWHAAATKENKAKSMYDFINCAEFLIAEGYTHPTLLCCMGVSAGGLLIGSVINIRPELFKVAILKYPFLDVLSIMLDKSLPIVASDHDEFGDPNQDPKLYDTIASYSPYENIEDQEYPAVLVISGRDDSRTPLWNVMKYVTRLRKRSLQPKRVNTFAPKNVLVKVNEGGHNGPVGTELGTKEMSTVLGFCDYVTMDQNKEIKKNFD